MPEESFVEECMQSFDIHRARFHSPFKLRPPTPPRSREASPKARGPKNKYTRHSSVELNDIFVLKIPFTGVSYVNQMTSSVGISKLKKNCKFKSCLNKKHRRSGSLEKYL